MQLVSPESVAAVMALHPVPHTLAELEARVREGLPKSTLRTSVESAASRLDAQRALLAQIILEATYKRCRTRLSRDESEKTERLARVVATAFHVWGNPEDARQFHATPHPPLEGRVPLNVGLIVQSWQPTFDNDCRMSG